MATVQFVTFGATGIMAAPHLSKELYQLAQYELQFDRFCELDTEFGKGKGDLVYWGVTGDLSGAPTTFAGATLSETGLIPKYSWSDVRAGLSISEIGSGVSYTSKAATLAAIDIDARGRSRLKNQLVRVLDNGAATQFKATDVKYSPTGAAAGTWSLTGTAGAAVTANLNAYHFREIADYLYATLRAEPYDEDGNYICITTRKGFRGLEQDPDFQEVSKYAQPTALLKGPPPKGEVGRYNRIRIFETNDSNVLSTKGAGAVCAEAVFFGSEAVKKAMAQAPLITAETKDHGRFNDVAWRALMGYGLMYDYTTVGKATVVHIDST